MNGLLFFFTLSHMLYVAIVVKKLHILQKNVCKLKVIFF